LRVSHIARYAPSLRLAKTPNIKRHLANITVQMVLVKTQAFYDYITAYHKKSDALSEVQPLKQTA
jgi:hypothetical protein